MRVLKYLLIGLGVVVGLVALAVGVVLMKGPDSRPASEEKIASTPERLARGKYLAHSVAACFSCHGERDWKRFAGPVVAGTEGGPGLCVEDPGLVCASNLTPHPQAGLGAWSDGEVVRAIREGIGRDGRPLSPVMPYSEYRQMSDEDVAALVVYLRTLPAIATDERPPQTPFPMNVLMQLMPEPVTGPVTTPAPGTPAHGEYLATLGNCRSCHGENPLTPGFQGGFAHEGEWGSVVASNLTPHPSGLGRMTREGFLVRFRAAATGAPVPEGGTNTPMPWTDLATLTDADLGDLYDYLRTVPPVDTAPPAQATR